MPQQKSAAVTSAGGNFLFLSTLKIIILWLHIRNKFSMNRSLKH